MAATTSRTELTEFACLIGVVLSSATLLPNRKLFSRLACVRCHSRHPVQDRFPQPECAGNKAAGAPYTPRADWLTSLFAGFSRGLWATGRRPAGICLRTRADRRSSLFAGLRNLDLVAHRPTTRISSIPGPPPRCRPPGCSPLTAGVFAEAEAGAGSVVIKTI